MSIQELGALGEFISVFLILITLIYLGVQNRYQQKLLLSQAYQARTDSAMRAMLETASNPVLADIIRKAGDESDLSTTEEIQYRNFVFGSLRHAENVHFQRQLGLIGDEAWDATQKTAGTYFQSTAFREMWREIRPMFRQTVAAWLDGAMEEVEQGQRAD